MDTLPAKPSSSRAGRDRDRHRDRDHTKHRDEDRHRSRHRHQDEDKGRDKDRDRDGDRNRRRRRHRRRSPSATPPPSKRSRTSGTSHKDKERIRNGHVGSGGIKSKTPEIGDDFIPLTSDTEAAPPDRPRSERARQKEKGKEREWDTGKSSRDYEEGRGTKRKHDYVYDEEDDQAYNRRQSFEPRKTPWVSLVDWDNCHNAAEILHREVEAFVNYMSPTPVEDEIRGLVIQQVSRAITSAFPDARIMPFGSYETKLYLPSGDIDLVIDSESMAYSNKVHVLHALANTLKRAGVTSKVTVISRAKVPIVKFVANFGHLNVDISVNQCNGVKAGHIVNCFLKDMRGCGFALRCLIVIAKAFLNQRGMNEVYTGGLGSYSIVCLAISFLQMHPKIRRGEIEPEKNLGVLVMEFFELYGSYFNYEEVGISIRDGGSYFSKRERGWYDFSRGLLLSIEDPLDITNDISRGSYGINKVRQTLAGAYGIMKATSLMRAGILSARREGRSYRLRTATNPEDMSILTSILGVTQEMISNRRLLQDVYDRRILHQLLQVAPQASVVVADVPIEQDTKGKSSAGSVREAWEGDMELESDDQVGREVAEDGNSDEGGRYDIQERRHTRSDGANGTGRFDPLATYTTDEDDLSEDEREDQVYDSAGSDDVRKRRRSYWLSKGIGPCEEEGLVVLAS